MTSSFIVQESPQVRVYMNDRLREHKTYTSALFQLANAATLEGVVEPVIGMPDLCVSYGLPVGGVIATDANKGEVSLNAIGGDINCGYSLSQTSICSELFLKDGNLSRNLGNSLTQKIKDKSRRKNSKEEGIDALLNGAWAREDPQIERIEREGINYIKNGMELTDEMADVAQKHLGTLGGGNHFIDLMKCSEMYDAELSQLWGINPDNVLTLIHTGSRGVGSLIKNKFSQPERYPTRVKKIFQPRKLDSKEGKSLLEKYKMGSNFAYANRSALRSKLDESLNELFGVESQSELIYDLGHNSINIEKRDGREVIVHRKGSSQALPSGHCDGGYYKETGTPIILPGSLGTDTYILVATERVSETFNSIAHGSGRKYSRGYVQSKSHHPRFMKDIDGVYVNLAFESYVEESPAAYKDIREVVATLEEAGLVKKVARLKPFYVFMEKEK